MATSQTSLLAFLSNDADFRSWGGGVSAAIQAVGLTQTADTGQVNWATVTRPGVVNTVAGYEVYRFSDTLQATAPVFIKVEYGVAGAVDRPSLWITVGTATNGAGTLAGQVGARTQSFPASASTAGTLRPWFVSGSSSRLLLAGNLTSNNSSFAMFATIERPKDGAGADTSDGILTFLVDTPQVIPFSGTVPTASTNIGPFVGLHFGMGANNGTNIALLPGVWAAAGRMAFSNNCLTYRTPDIAGGAPITVSLFGASRTYLPMAGYSFAGPPGVGMGSPVANTTWALLWE